ncbi:LAETG motif-containing sortase-dependent surface protein [Actinacidiphila oryziradicis]|uniref:TQXA domain-containing protein n=1 Tax=Actinacidiphila oryziradicis TaxID=2571141 RepID=A0A4U0SYZ9_9ACTN|nr:LAETG motif-containing sortase-dependent surface protein [Actinacidiphila oryziradicis]TKA13297.1 TQXA domain-containing protein [Actinacidiphila oryziradicis]
MFTLQRSHRRGVARLAAVVLASGLVAAGAITGAGSAAADGVTPTAGGATATLGGLKTFDQAVIHENGNDRPEPAGLFEMSVTGGGTIQTYCIDIHNPTQDKAKYQEVSWDQTSLHANANAKKINWILQNSYPQVNDLAALAKTAGIDGTLTPQLAAAGTQVAIWRFSDNAKVDAVNKDAEALANFLEKNAKDLAEPEASLTLEPTAVSGKVGDKLGPVTVRTNAGTAQVSLAPGAPSGVTIVGKDGKPVTTVSDGSELYFDVPAGTAAGTTSLSVTATTKLPVGRAFTGIDSTSQVQILAGSSDSTVSATASGTWANKGAIPAVTAEVDCAKSGVDVTATNEGDEDFTFTLAGKEHTVAPGKSETITVPVAEDQSYKITISGPNGFEKTFEGVLDCKTAGSGSGGSSATPSSAPSAASVGGGSSSSTTGGNLAETGSSSATPVIAGVAIALVVVGGGAVFLLRKKKPATPAE